MKSALKIFAACSVLFLSCTSGYYVTGRYTDDIYFNPGDIPPPVAVENITPASPRESEERFIISETSRGDSGSSTVKNYIFNDTGENADLLIYGMDNMELAASDTGYYYGDGETSYIVNNYYEGDNVDFAYRIRRFHNPYFYDPFYWDSWYYDPFYYTSWYYPYGSFSWNWGFSGRYFPYYSWGYPYYGWYGMYGPYAWDWWYPVYDNGGGWYDNYENYRYGQRRPGNTDVFSGSGITHEGNTSSVSSGTRSRNAGAASVRTAGAGSSGTVRQRLAGTGTLASNTSQQPPDTGVLTERRRTPSDSRTGVQSGSFSGNSGNPGIQTYIRPGTGSSGRVSSYGRSSVTGTQPRVTGEAGRSSRESSVRGTTSAYGNRSGSTYNMDTGTGVNTNTDRNRNTRTYSSPAPRNSSIGSYRGGSQFGGGSGYGGGGTSGSSVGGGTGSSGRTSSSGRR
jgi:hypothetical protein